MIAVVPFSNIHDDPLQHSMAEGLCWQITTRAMKLPNFFVIAYSTMRGLFEKDTNLVSIASMVGASFILTGYVQSVENQARIYIQLTDMHTNQQVWGKMYEREFNAENMFRLQDEIAKLVMSEIKGLEQLRAHRSAVASSMTIV